MVLTKSDLVDADWLELVEEETRERVEGTVLDGAPIVSVSAGHRRQGLRHPAAPSSTGSSPTRPRPLPSARPRLPVDRVFTVSGFGTVVTGTLIDGPVARSVRTCA